MIRKRGVAAVEMAVVLPVLILLLMGSMQLGRGVMVKHILEEVARAGCRVAVVESSTTSDVEAIVATAMKTAHLTNYTVTVSPNPPTEMGPFEAVTVTITIPYDQVSWVKAGFLEGRTLEGVCVMPAEADGTTLPDPSSGKKNKKDKKNKSDKKAKKD